jgi:Big-like domain-containing protein
MKHIPMVVLVLLLTSCRFFGAESSELSIKTLPPSVVKTVPQSGDAAVDPALKEISVTFNKDMMTNQMWSWCMQTPETFPEFDKNGIRYTNKRTCVMPVKLQPGRTYVIWINSQKFKSFKDTENNSAVPYLLVFETKK